MTRTTLENPQTYRRVSTGTRIKRFGTVHDEPRANVGRNHPDYGLSVAEHAANKLARSGRAY